MSCRIFVRNQKPSKTIHILFCRKSVRCARVFFMHIFVYRHIRTRTKRTNHDNNIIQRRIYDRTCAGRNVGIETQHFTKMAFVRCWTKISETSWSRCISQTRYSRIRTKQYIPTYYKRQTIGNCYETAGQSKMGTFIGKYIT